VSAAATVVAAAAEAEDEAATKNLFQTPRTMALATAGTALPRAFERLSQSSALMLTDPPM
jgi:hypothetical protein